MSDYDVERDDDYLTLRDYVSAAAELFAPADPEAHAREILAALDGLVARIPATAPRATKARASCTCGADLSGLLTRAHSAGKAEGVREERERLRKTLHIVQADYLAHVRTCCGVAVWSQDDVATLVEELVESAHDALTPSTPTSPGEEDGE